MWVLLLTHEKKFAEGLAYPAGQLLSNQSTRDRNNSPEEFLQSLRLGIKGLQSRELGAATVLSACAC
jgi:hypothetical protein